MARRRTTRFSRRTGASQKRSRVPAYILCVVIFLVLCFAISIAIGVLLDQSSDRISSRPKYDFQKVEYIKGNKSVKSIEGYFFAKGASAEDYYIQEIRDFSFCVRHNSGSLDYASTVADAFGFDESDGYTDLETVVKEIQNAGGRACGYFYVRAFNETNDGLRDVYAAYELALIEEMAQSGIDEILLLGIDVDNDNADEVEQFVAKASLMAKNTAIGVAVSLDTLRRTEQEIYYAARIKNACDFLALDLCHLTVKDGESGISEDGQRVPGKLEDIIGQNEYYIKSYSLRLVFCRDESQIYKAAIELGIVDFQIVDR